MMTSDKFLSSLCYFSVFFAPFLFPIMVWILTKDEVRYHAGKALWTHIVPYICIASGLITIAFTGTSPMTFSIIAVFTVIGIFYFLLNFIRGISVLLF